MKKLSIGMDSTLGSYLSLCKTFFGEDSAPTKYIQDKIAEQGEGMEVLATESQMMLVFGELLVKEREEK